MECEKILQLLTSSMDKNNWIDILSALLVPTIAIFGSLIAFMQWRINRARLKHELFDRRYQQFTEIKEFLGSIIISGKPEQKEQHKYLIGTRGIRFTYNKKIADYIEKNIWYKAIEIDALDSELEGVPVGEERTNNVHRQSEIRQQLFREFKNLEDLLAPYLQLKH